MAKFHGDFNELKSLVAELGYAGQWTEENGKNIFRSEDGAILNWWESTGTLLPQGVPQASTRLEAAISNSLAGSAHIARIASPTSTATPSAATSSNSSHDSSSTSEVSNKVFVVYGHDLVACEQLELILHRLNLEPFVLGNTSGGGLTIIEALEREIMSPTEGERFGIVLLTPDDMAYNRGDDPANVEPRARQNVVMEMGMLIAAFGRSRVAILRKGHVAVPSDASGIIYLAFNDHVKEAAPKLCQRLGEAGFELDPDLIAKASS